MYSVMEEESDNDDEMVDEGDTSNNKHSEEVAQALAVANAIGKTSTDQYDDIALALKALNMDNYDDEEDGKIYLFINSVHFD